MLLVKLKIILGKVYKYIKQDAFSSTYSLYGIFKKDNTPRFILTGSLRAMKI
jgi:hypothetical protein